MGKFSRLWMFRGFKTEAGNSVVQEWYWEGLDIDDRELIRDRIRYLGNIQRFLWKKPHFEYLDDIGEIRKATTHGALRVYGYFPDHPHTFVLLHGVVKKSKKDSAGMKLARARKKILDQAKGGTHVFSFKERTSVADSEESGDEG